MMPAPSTTTPTDRTPAGRPRLDDRRASRRKLLLCLSAPGRGRRWPRRPEIRRERADHAALARTRQDLPGGGMPVTESPTDLESITRLIRDNERLMARSRALRRQFVEAEDYRDSPGANRAAGRGLHRPPRRGEENGRRAARRQPGRGPRPARGGRILMGATREHRPSPPRKRLWPRRTSRWRDVSRGAASGDGRPWPTNSGARQASPWSSRRVPSTRAAASGSRRSPCGGSGGRCSTCSATAG